MSLPKMHSFSQVCRLLVFINFWHDMSNDTKRYKRWIKKSMCIKKVFRSSMVFNDKHTCLRFNEKSSDMYFDITVKVFISVLRTGYGFNILISSLCN